MSKALVVLAKGFEEIEALTVVDVLRRSGVEVITAALSQNAMVCGAHGIEVKTDALFSDVGEAQYDAIVLPGGGEGTENLKSSQALIARLQRQKDEDRIIAAICAAPTVLVEADVLEPGQHITCYPTCSPELDRPSADVPVVADGNIITGQAPGASMLFALVLASHLVEEKTVRKVARGLVTDVLEG